MHKRILLCKIAGCLLFAGLTIGLPRLMVTLTTSNGLGAGLYVLTVFGVVPLVSILTGVVSGTEGRAMWLLPAVPGLLSLLLWPIQRDMYFSFQAIPFLSMAAGYLAMLVCRRLCRKHTKS